MKSAIRTTATVFGVIIALAGLEHGVGEILQGNVPPSALVFESWPDSEFFEILAGEPAMSILPSMLISGIMTVIVSLALMVWIAFAPGKPYSGAGLIAFSVILLLVGGGLGPPFMLFVVGLAATRINRPVKWWHPKSPDSPEPLLARFWRAALGASVLGYLSMVPIIPIAEQLIGPVDTGIVAFVGLFSFASFFLAIIAALASDSYHSGLQAGREKNGVAG